MPARAAALCTRLLPTGKTCAQPSLRGECFCRFHNDARSRAIAEQDERTYAFYEELDAMTIYQLLETPSASSTTSAASSALFPRPSKPS